MEVTCPNCSKKYRVDESLIPEKGRKVKCRKCGNVFVIKREKPVPSNEEDFKLDLDFAVPPEASGDGTVRISQEQIDASIRKGEAADQPVQEVQEENRKIELDLEPKMSKLGSDMENSPPRKKDPNAVRYIARVEGNEFTGLTLDELKKWISEDRLLEADEVSREGSKVWVPAERVPELMKVFKMHVYEQRKHFDQEDNPYLRYKEREKNQVARPSKGGFFSNILSIFRKG